MNLFKSIAIMAALFGASSFANTADAECSSSTRSELVSRFRTLPGVSIANVETESDRTTITMYPMDQASSIVYAITSQGVCDGSYISFSESKIIIKDR
jgi:hypothetical protein